MQNESSRERTLIDLFSALEGRYGPNYECKYYPCHFAGQDCSFCFCPFYPCFIYDLGYLKSTTKGYVWSCKNCDWIHKKEVVEEALATLSFYPRQKLIEENWLFFNKIVQKLYYGKEIGEFIDSCYSLMGCLDSNVCKGVCEEVEKCEFLKVTIENFEIVEVKKCSSFESSECEGEVVYVPLLEGDSLYGYYNGKYLKCVKL